MAFKLYSTDDGHVPAWEYLPCGSIKPAAGLCLAPGALGELSISKLPIYICMLQSSDYMDNGTQIPVVKITDDQVWESTLNVATTFKVGQKVDISSNGLFVDGVGTTNGNFLITYLEGQEAGSVVRGRFV